MPPEVQPWLGASITDHSTRPSPAIDKPAPTGSSAACAGSRDSGTRRKPRTNPAITIGTFTMNTEPHQKCSSSTPPVIGTEAEAEGRHAGPHADGFGALGGIR